MITPQDNFVVNLSEARPSRLAGFYDTRVEKTE